MAFSGRLKASSACTLEGWLLRTSEQQRAILLCCAAMLATRAVLCLQRLWRPKEHLYSIFRSCVGMPEMAIQVGWDKLQPDELG